MRTMHTLAQRLMVERKSNLVDLGGLHETSCVSAKAEQSHLTKVNQQAVAQKSEQHKHRTSQKLTLAQAFWLCIRYLCGCSSACLLGSACLFWSALWPARVFGLPTSRRVSPWMDREALFSVISPTLSFSIVWCWCFFGNDGASVRTRKEPISLCTTIRSHETRIQITSTSAKHIFEYQFQN